MPATYEPLLVDDAADLNEIAEEEILLAIPLSPIHETECTSVEPQAALEADAEGLEQVEDSGERDSPFAVLERLKS